MAKQASRRADDISILEDIERQLLWLSTYTVHHANHVRPNADGLKVGGHQASCASMVSVMTALYFRILRSHDRVAVKPHASPVYHAIQYLFGRQTVEQLQRFRGYGGAQSYPSRTKDHDDVDFSTGSVGLGVAITAFASMVQDYVRSKDWGEGVPDGRMVALLGDAELDEGNIFECLLEGYKHDLRNTWWIVDYNRQSLDSVSRKKLHEKFAQIFESFDWQVVTLKYGRRLTRLLDRPGGGAIRDWIDACPNDRYAALTFQGGAAWRRALLDGVGDQGATQSLIDSLSDAQLAEVMTDLGGHCLETLLEAFEAIDHDRPVCFFAYTIKGHRLPIAGHKDNHAGMLNPAQIDAFRKSCGVRPGSEWDRHAAMRQDPTAIDAFIRSVPFLRDPDRRLRDKPIPVPKLTAPTAAAMSTQEGFGRLLFDLAARDAELADRIVTTSPDVTVSTNLGGWVNRRGLFGRSPKADLFSAERIPTAQKWQFSAAGQHIELGIAENNLFLLLGALGLSHSLFGRRVIPVGTLYDPFIQRGLDALNYACYQDARFILAATPSGITLAPEGGAHQSISTPLIGIGQDGLAYFEPAFVDELAVILEWAFDYVQRDGEADLAPGDWLRDVRGGSVYLRLSTRSLEQPKRILGGALAAEVLSGAYWLRRPGPGCTAVIAYCGAVAPEAIEAAGLLAERHKGIGVLAVTSADRLSAEWCAARRARRDGVSGRYAHAEDLLSAVPRDALIVTVLDGHPATLSWLGSVHGHRVVPLGVEYFGQTGSIADLYRHFGIDTHSIAGASVPGNAQADRAFERMTA